MRIAAEPALPEPVAEHHHATVTAWPCFVRSERPAQRGADTEHVEQLRRRLHLGHLFGAICTENVRGDDLDERERVERMRARPPLEKVQRMHRNRH